MPQQWVYWRGMNDHHCEAWEVCSMLKLNKTSCSLKTVHILGLLCLAFYKPALVLSLITHDESSRARQVLARREALRGMGAMMSGTTGIIRGGGWLKPGTSLAIDDVLVQRKLSAYQVLPDDSLSLNPTLVSLTSEVFLEQVASSPGGVIWLGEHHNSVRDHNIQAQLIRQIRQLRGVDAPLALGLEQVQIQFQPVLDDYIAGTITLREMQQQVEWDIRWSWPFEIYEPIFVAAREHDVALVALNVDSEDLILVEKGGLGKLPRDRLKKYIIDGPGFAEFARRKEFSTYVNYVIEPSYAMHQAMGLLRYTMSGEKLDEAMSFRNFFSGRILWDEAMATRAYQWTSSHRGGMMLGLVGADHVKFRNGIPGRYVRMAGGTYDCKSVILNPTLIDTRPPGTVSMLPEAYSSDYPDRLTLQLRYVKDGIDSFSSSAQLPESTGGVMPLADYLLIG